VFVNESRGVSNPKSLVLTIELKRHALAISTVGSLNTSCGSKVPYIGFICFLRENKCAHLKCLRLL
jgi:hypothetical protein